MNVVISRFSKRSNLFKIVGQATVELTPFKRIIGIDPGTRMIEQAAQNFRTQGLSDRIESIKSPAESIPLEDGSVDFITSGNYEASASLIQLTSTPISAQAAHWFDWQKVWPEVARVLRKDGTIAIWVCPQLTIFTVFDI